MTTTPLVGSVFAGYRLEELVARGGMGVVYRATHLRLERQVALKLLAPELAQDDEFRERFLKEAALAASLEHPNVVPVYDAGEEDGVLYLAMRYLAGGDLRQLLQRQGRLSLERTLQLVEELAGALDAAHETGLVHRDVKPANILFSERRERAYLGDFGVARRQSSRGLTQTGSFLGSVDYCAPEQIESALVDGRADIYALGGVCFHCLTGQPPYVRETEVAVLSAHLRDPPPALSRVRPDLPPALDGVLVTAMAKYPQVRYETAGAFAQALRAAVAQPRAPATVIDNAPAAPPPPAEPATGALSGRRKTAVLRQPPTGREGSRRGLVVGAVGVALALGAAGAVAAVALSGRTGDREQVARETVTRREVTVTVKEPPTTVTVSTPAPPPPPTSPPVSSTGDKTLVAGAFSIRYPRGWWVRNVETDKGTYYDTTILDPANSGRLMRVDYSPATNAPPEVAAAPVIRALARQPGYRELDRSATTFLGYAALRWEFLVRESGVLLHKVDVFFVDENGTGWAVLYETPASEWASLSARLQELVYSLELR